MCLKSRWNYQRAFYWAIPYCNSVTTTTTTTTTTTGHEQTYTRKIKRAPSRIRLFTSTWRVNSFSNLTLAGCSRGPALAISTAPSVWISTGSTGNNCVPRHLGSTSRFVRYAIVPYLIRVLIALLTRELT